MHILTIDGCFNCVTSRVKVLGWLEKKKKEEEEKRKKINNSGFQVGHLRIVSGHYSAAAGTAYISCFKC